MSDAQIWSPADEHEQSDGPGRCCQFGMFGESHVCAKQPAEVDSLDDMQPVPHGQGRFFAELIVREEIELTSGLRIPGQNAEDEEENVAPKRATVVQLSEVPPDGGWSFKTGYEVVVPFHAGHRYKWINQAGIEESVWILSDIEVLAVFRPRT